MAGRPIRRTDRRGGVWRLALEDRGEGVWGYWYGEKPAPRSSAKRLSPGTRFVFTAKQAKEFQEHAFSPERHKDERMERRKERASRGRATFREAVKQEATALKRERSKSFDFGSGADGIRADACCPVCDRWAFLDGTVRHASHCTQRYWHATFDSTEGRARRGKTKTEKELLREFQGAGLKSTHEWVTQAPALGLSNWSTYQRRFRDDPRRRAGESVFEFVLRLSKRARS